jgi:hypothetical protein
MDLIRKKGWLMMWIEARKKALHILQRRAQARWVDFFRKAADHHVSYSFLLVFFSVYLWD